MHISLFRTGIPRPNENKMEMAKEREMGGEIRRKEDGEKLGGGIEDGEWGEKRCGFYKNMGGWKVILNVLSWWKFSGVVDEAITSFRFQPSKSFAAEWG